MKIINLSFLLLILTIVFSCEKEEVRLELEEPYSLTLDLQNGFWDVDGDDLIAKFDSITYVLYLINTQLQDDYCKFTPPATLSYTLEDSIISFNGGGPNIIKIEGDILTLKGVYDNKTSVYTRKSTNYPDC